MKCASVAVKSMSKVPFALILPMNNKGTVERYSLLSGAECIVKTAHCIKCVSVVVESISEVPFALILPMSNQRTVERNCALNLFMNSSSTPECHCSLQSLKGLGSLFGIKK